MRLGRWQYGKRGHGRLRTDVAQAGHLVLALFVVACSGSKNAPLFSTGGQGGDGAEAGTGGGTPGTGGASDQTGSGGDNVDEAGSTVEEASMGTGGQGTGGRDETVPVDAHGTPQPEAEGGDMPTPSPVDASDAPIVDTGPRTLFSFDTDAEFTQCAGDFIIPPCWLTDGGDGGGGGTFMPVAEDAVPGHAPARALRWRATYDGFGSRSRLVATFASNQNWTTRTRLHFWLKVVSGFSSIMSYDLFVQGGVETQYAAIYQFNLPDTLVSEGGSGFVEVVIDFTQPSVDRSALAGVAGLGVALRAIQEPLGGEAAPVPTVIEVDNIWLE